MKNKVKSYSEPNTALISMSEQDRIEWFCGRYREKILKQVKNTIDRTQVNIVDGKEEKRNDYYPFLVTVCAVIDSLGAYYTGKTQNATKKRFLKFMEDYLDPQWQTKKEKEKSNQKISYAERFYTNFRCSLIHSMVIANDAIENEQQDYFDYDENRKEYRLGIKTDALKEDFVKGVEKYLKDLENSSPGEDIWKNFNVVFEHYFRR